jgi:hypothetical protein
MASSIAPSSSISNISQTRSTITIPPNFWSVFIRDYPDSSIPALTEGRQRKTNGTARWTCRVCVMEPRWATRTRSNAIKHCINKHSTVASVVEAQQTSITSHFSSIVPIDKLRNIFNQNAYKEAIVGLLCRRRLSFAAVEWSEFRDIALACNPAIDDLLITSRRTAVRLIAANYNLYSEQLSICLSRANSPIHIQSDLWTSPHRHALLAVCGQWIDHDFKLQKALLGLVECPSDHSGEAQAGLILQVLEKYDIQSNIGWHTGDNATSNDTTLETLESRLLAEHSVD